MASAPPVLVIHEGLGSLDSMSHQVIAISKCALVIAPDTRGHGRSGDSEAQLSYSLLARDMLKLLDHLGIGQVDVVGWSDGGIVGLELAVRHPERIKKLVVIGGNYDVDGLVEKPTIQIVPKTPISYRLSSPNPTHWPDFYRKVVLMWQTEPHFTVEELARITAPTLLIAGEFDAIKTVHTDALARAIQGSQEVIIKGGTHSVPIKEPEKVNAQISKFLSD